MDRDFLFGVIAVQLGQATPAQVMAAASAFVADPSKGIVDRLRGDGVIDHDRFRMLESMVDEAVTAHGGDVRKTIQSMGGSRVLLTSFGGSIVQNDQGDLAVVPAPQRSGDSTEDGQAVTIESPGRYRLEGEELGRGGIGRVLIAFDEHLGREVALKELLPDVGRSHSGAGSASKTGAVAARFLREARVTGQLEHPNIIPVYELGQRSDGTYYYAMKLVRGRTLAEALSACRTLAERLELLPHYVDLCQAIAYAHSRGVIHRDIKPDNVMLGEFGETVVVDWGLAKVAGKKDIRGGQLQRDLKLLHDKSTGKTMDGSAIGTPAYMSPEQADGAVADIDERSDVWSLGALLYELLTGRPPFEGVTPFEIIGKVLKDDVVAPGSIDEHVPAELSAVALKALRRDKASRYETARLLASEISAYMTGGRINAYEYSSWELLRGFVRRNRALSAMTAIIALLVLLGSAAMYQAYRRAEDNERIAVEHGNTARMNERTASYRLATAYSETATRLLQQNDALGARVFAAASLVYNPANPKSPYHDGNVPFEQARGEQVFLEAYSTFYQATLAATVRPDGVIRSDHPMFAVSFSADGRLLASAGEGPEVGVWDVATKEAIRKIRTEAKSVPALAYAPNGRLLAVAGGSGAVWVYDADSFAVARHLQGDTGEPRALAFSPDSSRLAVLHASGKAMVWRISGDDAIDATIEASGDGRQVAFAPDGSSLALPGADGGLMLWDVKKRRAATTLLVDDDRRGVGAVAFAPSGRWLFLAVHPLDLYVWSRQDARLRVRLFGPTAEVMGLAFSPEADLLASVGRDKHLRLWETESFGPVHVLAGHQRAIRSVAAAPGAPVFATASEDGSVRLWRQVDDARKASFGGSGEVYYVAFSPDGTKLFVGGFDPSLWDIARHERIARFEGGLNAAFSADSTLLAISGAKGEVVLWDLRTNHERARLRGHARAVRHLAFAPDARTLATGDRTSSVRVWDVATGAVRYKLDSGAGVAISPDGRVLATGYDPSGIRLWELSSGKALRTLEGHAAQVDDIAFSHDGKWLASGDLSGGVRLWDLGHGDASHELTGHLSWVNSVAFSPDDSLLITSSDDWDARVWSVASKKTVLLIKTPTECVGTAFSPDGKSVLVDWGNAARLMPLDLSVRDADPRHLLEASQRDAGLKLDGVALVPTD